MTDKNDMDEFEQEQFDALDSPETTKSGSMKDNLVDAWRNKPVVKLLVIMIGISAAIALVMGVATKDREAPISQLASPPGMQEAPGGPSSPFFIEQNAQANRERVGYALAEGGSAIPTPVGRDVTDNTTNKKEGDPINEFREDTQRLKEELRREQEANARKLQALEQQMMLQNTANARNAMAQDDSLAQAMQRQLQKMMDGWTPTRGQYIAGAQEPVPVTPVTAPSASSTTIGMANSAAVTAPVEAPMPVAKTLVPAGTVNYIQLLTEANSDVPGPILAQILSGPLAGGRAIGQFQVANDLLVMTFNTVSLKGKDYSINGLALDPDTTLGGMATEVDHRYMTRVLLPAAGAFVSAFGEALGDTETTTTVSDGVAISDSAKKGYKEAIYDGLGSIGESVSEFFKNEANRTQTLVRVAVGTPMGLFFLAPVTDQQATYEPNRNVLVPTMTTPIYDPNKSSSSMMGLAGSGMPESQMNMINQMMSTLTQASSGMAAQPTTSTTVRTR